MRWDGIYIAGVGAYLPTRTQTAEDAIAAGLYSAEENAANGIRSVHVAGDDEPPPVMAARAGNTAVARSGHDKRHFDLVLHACVGHQGQDFWTPVSYVQEATVGGHGAAIEVRQSSNGGLAALELAASHLAARPHSTAALITTADAFRLPYFDRWNSESQHIYGDGAGALVLSSDHGFARLRSTASYSDSSLEPIYRGTEGWTTAPFYDGQPVDLSARKRDYLLSRVETYEEVIQQMAANQATVLRIALDDAGVELADTRFFVHANIAETIVQFSFNDQLGLDRSATTYDWGRDFGHMGAGDQLIGLNHLMEAQIPARGDLLVTLGVGIGFMWTAAVLEILDLPAW